MIIKTAIKNGKKIIYGKGTPAEIETLNIENDFDSVLDCLNQIRKTANKLFGNRNVIKLNKRIYGKRQAV
ncbi:MAG: hypothetical protein WC955_12890 [Elusimicrobiota bacterium]